LRPAISILLLLCAVPFRAQPVIVGAGATFPAPIYAKWFATFAERRQDFRIRYESVGSEAGIRRFREGTADFAASDMPLDEAQLSALGRPVLQLPSTLGAVVPIYRLDGVTGDLRLTPDALAGIFLGRVKRWNHPLIQSANPNLRLPDREIAVVHRSDGSGTTFIWTDYLSKVSPEWKAVAGTGASIQWPVGSAEAGNEGVALRVRSTPDSIGYVEFIYALFNRLSYAQVRNSAGRFIEADLDSIAAAAGNSARNMPASFRLSLADASGRRSYPIAAFTYLLIPARAGDPKKDAFIRELLAWILTSGQRQAAALGFVSIPPAIIAREQSAVAALQ
jgi:phosphate transport system substrate-binding protein